MNYNINMKEVDKHMRLSEIINHYVPDYTKTVWDYKILINRNGTFYKEFVIVEIFSKDIINPDSKWNQDKILWFDKQGKIIMIEGRYAVNFYNEDSNKFDKELLSIMVNEGNVQLDYKNCKKLKKNIIFDDRKEG